MAQPAVAATTATATDDPFAAVNFKPAPQAAVQAAVATTLVNNEYKSAEDAQKDLQKSFADTWKPIVGKQTPDTNFQFVKPLVEQLQAGGMDPNVARNVAVQVYGLQDMVESMRGDTWEPTHPFSTRSKLTTETDKLKWDAAYALTHEGKLDGLSAVAAGMAKQGKPSSATAATTEALGKDILANQGNANTEMRARTAIAYGSLSGNALFFDSYAAATPTTPAVPGKSVALLPAAQRDAAVAGIQAAADIKATYGEKVLNMVRGFEPLWGADGNMIPDRKAKATVALNAVDTMTDVTPKPTKAQVITAIALLQGVPGAKPQFDAQVAEYNKAKGIAPAAPAPVAATPAPAAATPPATAAGTQAVATATSLATLPAAVKNYNEDVQKIVTTKLKDAVPATGSDPLGIAAKDLVSKLESKGATLSVIAPTVVLALTGPDGLKAAMEDKALTTGTGNEIAARDLARNILKAKSLSEVEGLISVYASANEKAAKDTIKALSKDERKEAEGKLKELKTLAQSANDKILDAASSIITDAKAATGNRFANLKVEKSDLAAGPGPADVTDNVRRLLVAKFGTAKGETLATAAEKFGKERSGLQAAHLSTRMSDDQWTVLQALPEADRKTVYDYGSKVQRSDLNYDARAVSMTVREPSTAAKTTGEVLNFFKKIRQ